MASCRVLSSFFFCRWICGAASRLLFVRFACRSRPAFGIPGEGVNGKRYSWSACGKASNFDRQQMKCGWDCVHHNARVACHCISPFLLLRSAHIYWSYHSITKETTLPNQGESHNGQGDLKLAHRLCQHLINLGEASVQNDDHTIHVAQALVLHFMMHVYTCTIYIYIICVSCVCIYIYICVSLGEKSHKKNSETRNGICTSPPREWVVPRAIASSPRELGGNAWPAGKVH